MAGPISYWCNFNGVELSTIVPGIQIYNINPYVLPHRTLNMWQLARRHARKLSSQFYDARAIDVSLYIIQPSRILLDQALDILYQNLAGNEVNLVIPQSGTSRQYIATFDSHIHNSPRTGVSTFPAPQGGYHDMSLIFQCSDSYGYDTIYTPFFNVSNQSAKQQTNNITFGGSAETQAPFIEIAYSGTLGTHTTDTVTIGNGNTGQSIVVTRAWSPGDLLQIDVRNRTVQVNATDVAFTGDFPEFGLGLQTITYLDTFSSRLYRYFIYYYKRWL